MNTKKALKIFTKGANTGDSRNSPLEQHSQKYLEQFEAREAAVNAKKEEISVNLPFVDVLKRKVAKLVDGLDTGLPVVTRFDLYTCIRKISERAPSDVGLKRLAHQLERTWHEDPLGALNYNAVRTIVVRYRDQYPTSKAADAVEAECGRVGLHKLPVAKLARIAANINSQEDYDAAMIAAGYNGNRPEQVRARTLVRELVALRDTHLDAHVTGGETKKSIDKRIAERFEMEAQKLEEEKMGPPDFDAPPIDLEAPIEGPVDLGPGLEGEPPVLDMAPMDAPAELGGPSGEEVDVGQGVNLMKDIEQQILEETPEEVMDYVQHEQAEGHTAPPGSAAWGAEEILNTHGGEGPTGDGHSAPPPSDEWVEEELAEIERQEGHEAPLGTPEHEMEEVKEHEEAPASFGEGQPEEPPFVASKEEPPMPEKPKKSKKEPKEEAKKEAKGLQPSQAPKSQPKVTTYAPKPSSGAKALRAMIEDRLLSGEMVKEAGISIHINDNDEVEIWEKDAGRACSLQHLDGAISDFLNMTHSASEGAAKSKVMSNFTLTRVIPVPCEKCASVSIFPVVAEDNEYACECGNTMHVASALALAKVAQYGQMWKLELGVNVQDPRQRNEVQRKILSMIQSVRGSKIDDERPGYVLASISGDETEVMKLVRSLKPLGANLVSDPQRVAELLKDAQVMMPQEAPVAPPAPPVAPPAEEPVSEVGMEDLSLGDIGGDDLPSMDSIPMDAPAPVLSSGPVSPEMVNAAFMTYKSRGDDLMQAMSSFKSDFKDQLKSLGDRLPPEVESAMAGAMVQHFSSGKMASVKTAEGGLKIPSVKKDHKAPNASPTKMDKDHEQEDLPVPFKRVKPTHSPSSQSGTALPAKKLDKNTELDDNLPLPGGEPSVTHSPTSQRGTSLPNKKLDSDSELNSGFAVPAPKAVPGTSKK